MAVSGVWVAAFLAGGLLFVPAAQDFSAHGLSAVAPPSGDGGWHEALVVLRTAAMLGVVAKVHGALKAAARAEVRFDPAGESGWMALGRAMVKPGSAAARHGAAKRMLAWPSDLVPVLARRALCARLYISQDTQPVGARIAWYVSLCAALRCIACTTSARAQYPSGLRVQWPLK